MATGTSIDRSERRRFVPLEFHALLDSGFFRPEERPWLSDGVIVDAVTDKPRRFTGDDLERMADLGFFDADGEDRLELIDGEILTMARAKPLHSAGIDRATRLFYQKLADRAFIRVQLPLFLGDEEQPIPDLAMVRKKEDDYRTAHPRSDDTFLVLEVMDASVHRDRNVKLPKYAESGIPEVWLVDIRGREIEVCRQPVGHQYLDRRIFVRGQTLAPEAFPDVVLNVQDIVG